MGSITWHDFLLGCIVLCLTVCAARSYPGNSTCAAVVDVVNALNLLRNAKAVCEQQSSKSKDTKKVHRLIEATIQISSGRDHGSATVTQPLFDNDGDEASQPHWNATQHALSDRD